MWGSVHDTGKSDQSNKMVKYIEQHQRWWNPSCIQHKSSKCWHHLRVILHLKEGEGEAAQLCPIVCDPMDCNLLGYSIHGILQARILEWIAIFFSISFSRGSSRPRYRTQVSCIGGRRFNLWATKKAHILRKPVDISYFQIQYSNETAFPFQLHM